jgi:hypothetical protein
MTTPHGVQPGSGQKGVELRKTEAVISSKRLNNSQQTTRFCGPQQHKGWTNSTGLQTVVTNWSGAIIVHARPLLPTPMTFGYEAIVCPPPPQLSCPTAQNCFVGKIFVPGTDLFLLPYCSHVRFL